MSARKQIKMVIMTRNKDVYGSWTSSWMESTVNELNAVMYGVASITFSYENGNVYLWDADVTAGQPGNFAVISDNADVELQSWSTPAIQRGGFVSSPFEDTDNSHLSFYRAPEDE